MVSFLAVLSVSWAGMQKLGLNPNNRVFFGPSDPQFSALLEFESQFGSNTSLLFGISSAGDLTEDPNLVAAIRWLTDRAWLIDGVSRVDSLATYPYGEYSEDDIELTTLLDAFCKDTCEDVEALRQPHIVNRFISEDGKTAAVLASVELDAEDAIAVSKINAESQAVISEFEAEFPTLQIWVTGAVPMMQAFMDASNNDLGSLVIVAVALFVLLLWLFLRGVYLTLVLVGLGISSIVITMGVAGWLGHIVNTATATTPLVIFTLVVAASMHVFLYIARDPCGDQGEVLKALERAYAANTSPVLLAAATSVVGLLSLLTVSAPPIRELGMLSAFGVLVGTVLLLFVVPCALSLLRSVNPSKALVVVQRWLNSQARRIELERERPGLFVILFVSFLAFLPMMNVDEDFVRYFGAVNSFRVNSEAMTQRLAGPYHVEVVLDTGLSGGIYDPSVIGHVEELVAFLRNQKHVANVLAVTDILKEVARSLDNRQSLEGLDADALAQFFLSFELALAKGQSTTDFVDVDHRMVRVSVLFGDVSMMDIRRFEDVVSEWADENLPDDLHLAVTGEGIPTAHLSSESIRQLAVGIFLSLVFSSVLIGFIYRSLRMVIVILMATTIPVLAGFGLWALFVGEIGMAATLVIAVTIGVVIDDSIHLLYRYRDGLSELDLSPSEAAGYSILRTAAAIVTTSVVLAGGFSVLMLSDFRMNSAFGMCSALVIVLALVYNTTVMPRALTWASRSGNTYARRDAVGRQS
jgi:predicted RND superfamily exporter protein